MLQGAELFKAPKVVITRNSVERHWLRSALDLGIKPLLLSLVRESWLPRRNAGKEGEPVQGFLVAPPGAPPGSASLDKAVLRARC